MYYSYPCFKCGRMVWEYEDDQEAEYDFWDKLTEAMKVHWEDYHKGEPLPTDSDLRYYFKSDGKMQKTPEKPSNPAEV